MILLLDTSNSLCHVRLVAEGLDAQDSWDAGRELSKGILSWLQDFMTQNGKKWSDISGIVVFQGPGSFTGLRIGITVMNTVSYSEGVPVVGTTGEDWQGEGLERLNKGENDHVVVPVYGAEANITQPRK